MSRSKKELVRYILESDADNTVDEEEMLHLLLERKFAVNAESASKNELTFGERMADSIAQFAGSWTFIISFVSCLLLWIIVNAFILSNHAFDVYPFILLNLILSCVAALQAPVIMMSQNRQEAKDRLRSQNDYKINLKSEIFIEDLHRKLDQLLEEQHKIYQMLEQLQPPAPAPTQAATSDLAEAGQEQE